MSVELGPVELRCPRDHSELTESGGALTCAEGHGFRITSGIPILLFDDGDATHPVFRVSLEKEEAPEWEGPGIDPRVRDNIGPTCGVMYRPAAREGFSEYPIPTLRLPRGEGKTLLDVGSHWGRWSIAASRLGYKAVGVDPSIDGIAAARSVAKQLDSDASFVVGESRHLPFADDAFDVVFSYGVFQHFPKPDVLASFDEIARVLKPGGTVLVQLANAWGARSLMNQVLERRYKEQRNVFDIRYWTPAELKQELEQRIGPTELFVDGYITLNPQPTDLYLLPRKYRAIVHVSEALRKAADRMPPLLQVADSIYARSTASA